VLLLRRAVASLRAAGHAPSLFAPASAGAALLGSAASDVDRLVAWDRPEAAALLTDEGAAPGELRNEIARFDVALAYTRSAPLVRSLARLVPKVLTCDPQPGAGHASDWLTTPLAELSVPIVDPPIHEATPSERDAARRWRDQLPASFLALHPGSGSPAKNWPAARFAQIANALSSGRPWLLVHGPADREATAALARLPNAVRAENLPARTLGALLSDAGLFIGNDSGVSHLAAAWGAPTLALFGPTDPSVWAPVGPRVVVVRSPTNRIDDLAPEDVTEAARHFSV
jgi:hypothetical protein